MLLRRLLAAFLMIVLAALPTLGQEKDKDKKEAPVPAGPKVLLKWKFEKDKSFYQKMNTVTKQTMKVMNSDVTQTQEQTFYFSWTPVKQDGDNWEVKQKIEGVAMAIDIGGTKITYDSTKSSNANNPLSDFFKALVDAEFVMTFNKDFKVTKISGREELVKKLTAANPQMKPLLDQILSEKALMEMAEPTFAAIPNKEVEKGKPWTNTTTLDMGPIGSYVTSYTYTYEGKDEKEKNLDKIKVDAKLTYKEPAADVAGSGGLPFKIKSANLASKDATGFILVDADKGRIAKTDMSLKLEGDLNIEIGGQTTKVNLSQTQTTAVVTADKSYVEAKPPVPAPAGTKEKEKDK